jgi:hypothetical protein
MYCELSMLHPSLSLHISYMSSNMAISRLLVVCRKTKGYMIVSKICFKVIGREGKSGVVTLCRFIRSASEQEPR